MRLIVLSIAVLMMSTATFGQDVAKPVQRTMSEQARIDAAARADRERVAQKAKDLKLADRLEREAKLLDIEVIKETTYPSRGALAGVPIPAARFRDYAQSGLASWGEPQLSRRGIECKMEADGKRREAAELRARWPKPKRQKRTIANARALNEMYGQ